MTSKIREALEIGLHFAESSAEYESVRNSSAEEINRKIEIIRAALAEMDQQEGDIESAIGQTMRDIDTANTKVTVYKLAPTEPPPIASRVNLDAVNVEAERKTFEAWRILENKNTDFCRNMPDASYNNTNTQERWLGWLARAERDARDADIEAELKGGAQYARDILIII